MADGADFDFSELDHLSADIAEAAAGVKSRLPTALGMSAGKIKDAWRDKLEGSETLPALPYAVTYDVEEINLFGVDVVRAEIGFDKSRTQGPLGSISEYGTPSTPPRGYGHAALEETQEDFQRGVEKALADSLKDAGL